MWCLSVEVGALWRSCQLKYGYFVRRKFCVVHCRLTEIDNNLSIYVEIWEPGPGLVMSGIFTTIEQDFHLTTAIFTPLSLQYFPTLLDFISQRDILNQRVISMPQPTKRISECERVDQKTCFYFKDKSSSLAQHCPGFAWGKPRKEISIMGAALVWSLPFRYKLTCSSWTTHHRHDHHHHHH